MNKTLKSINRNIRKKFGEWKDFHHPGLSDPLEEGQAIQQRSHHANTKNILTLFLVLFILAFLALWYQSEIQHQTIVIQQKKIITLSKENAKLKDTVVEAVSDKKIMKDFMQKEFNEWQKDANAQEKKWAELWKQ